MFGSERGMGETYHLQGWQGALSLLYSRNSGGNNSYPLIRMRGCYVRARMTSANATASIL